ncbi:MAG: hypothetical protein EXS55_04865 [Candidatus Magasanikbacteria bacterium]|nr:hypothetical protein [Candidatus Magasanikbacteria bacterium]
MKTFSIVLAVATLFQVQGIVFAQATKAAPKVWSTVKISPIRDIDGYQKALKEGDFRLDEKTEKLFYLQDGMKLSLKIGEEVDLVKMTMIDLGFKKNGRANMEDILAKAEAMGLKACSPHVALQLRLDYRNQPKRELIVIGMKPLYDYYRKQVMVLDRNIVTGHLWLSYYAGAEGEEPVMIDEEWQPQLVFVLPRKEK